MRVVYTAALEGCPGPLAAVVVVHPDVAARYAERSRDLPRARARALVPETLEFIEARFAGEPFAPPASCEPSAPTRCRGTPE